MSYFLENGQPIVLGEKIGHGGEGAVFHTPRPSDVVIKIYHSPLSTEHEQKLRSMFLLTSYELQANTAWPQALIFKKGQSSPQGVLIPRVSGLEMHEVYGPASRKQLIPDAGWAFLIHVAKNIATAFAILHKKNVVIGDVNEKNFMVSKDARIKLIDCDSYQIPSAKGGLHLCRVGVPLYTSPELQDRSLSGIVRTPNHDNFGLSVLIFQLLIMGRHPFAGVPKDPRLGALDNGQAIKNYLYAYNRNSTIGISPPPHTLDLNILPGLFRDYFELAFSRQGAEGKRPSAEEWFNQLEALSKNLKTCGKEKLHQYPSSLVNCPWCEFTRTAGITFFISANHYVRAEYLAVDSMELDKLIASLKSLILDPYIGKTFQRTAVKGQEVPQKLRMPGGVFYSGIFIILIALCFFASSSTAVWGIIGCIWGFNVARKGWRNAEFTAEFGKRKSAFEQGRSRLENANKEIERLVNEYRSSYQRLNSGIEQNYDRIRNIPNEHRNEVDKLQKAKRQVQLEQYLERFLISKYKIENIGPNRKAVLLSYGIETAADIKERDIHSVPGFSDGLCRILLNWRAEKERGFTYNPNIPLPQQALDELSKKMGALKTTLIQKIKNDARLLNDLNNQTSARYNSYVSQMPSIIKMLDQAEADFKAIN